MNFAIGDIVIVAIILLSALFGLRGFFKSLSGFMGFVAAIIIAVLLCDLVAGFVGDMGFIVNFRSQIESKLVSASADFGQVKTPDYFTSDVASQILTGMGLPAIVGIILGKPTASALQSVATANPSLNVAEVCGEAIIGTAVKVAVIILLVIILTIVIKLVMKKLNKLCKRNKVANFINRLLGFVFNLVLGFVIVMVIDYILTLIPVPAIADFKAQSSLFTLISDNNLLTAVLTHQDIMATLKSFAEGLIPAFTAIFAPKA